VDKGSKSHLADDADARLRDWRHRAAAAVPSLSAVLVVVVALTATVVVTREDWQEASRPAVLSMGEQQVVRAPPLVQPAPGKGSPEAAGQPQHRPEGATQPNALGAGPACLNCGVVESVAPGSRQGAFQLRIRMDDGSLRTIEQRGAVAAGSRVLLEGGSLRLMSPASRQG
jgi:hypothetical protein